MKVAIVGKLHSGKTTTAQALVDHFGYQRMAFADPVKEVSGVMLAAFENHFAPPRVKVAPYTIAQMNDMKKHPSIRKLLQVVGTELGREWRYNTFWIDQLTRKVTRAESLGVHSIVVDDCRFPNEADALRAHGFTIVKLVRDDHERAASVYDALRTTNPDYTTEQLEQELRKMMEHPSEQEIDNILPDMTYPSTSVEQLHVLAATIHEGISLG